MKIKAGIKAMGRGRGEGGYAAYYIATAHISGTDADLGVCLQGTYGGQRNGDERK